jgi:hypothetical protein
VRESARGLTDADCVGPHAPFEHSVQHARDAAVVKEVRLAHVRPRTRRELVQLRDGAVPLTIRRDLMCVSSEQQCRLVQ